MADKDSALADEGRETQNEVQKLNRKWQGKFDKLLQEKKSLEQQMAEQAEQESDAERKLRERQEHLDRKERVLSLATEKGIDPEKAFRLIGLDGADDSERLEALGEFIDEASDAKLQAEIQRRFPKNHRKPEAGVTPWQPTYEELISMGPNELKKFPAEMVSAAVDTATEDTSLRGRISKWLGR